jgi:hypothetical protein
MKQLGIIVVAIWILFFHGYSTLQGLSQSNTGITTAIQRGAELALTPPASVSAAPATRPATGRLPAPAAKPAAAIAVPTAAPATATPQPTLSAVQLQDPEQNGGNIAPAGCQFPAMNGTCANGGDLNEDVAPGEMAKPIATQAPIAISPIATQAPGAIPNPSLGQCLHNQVFTDQGCKNPQTVAANERAKP